MCLQSKVIMFSRQFLRQLSFPPPLKTQYSSYLLWSLGSLAQIYESEIITIKLFYRQCFHTQRSSPQICIFTCIYFCFGLVTQRAGFAWLACAPRPRACSGRSVLAVSRARTAALSRALCGSHLWCVLDRSNGQREGFSTRFSRFYHPKECCSQKPKEPALILSFNPERYKGRLHFSNQSGTQQGGE